jgi:hypothetical protein
MKLKRIICFKIYLLESLLIILLIINCQKNKEVLIPLISDNINENKIEYIFSGGVIDPNYKPVENAKITVQSANESYSTLTSKFGYFEFKLTKKDYIINIEDIFYVPINESLQIDSSNVFITYQFKNWKSGVISGELIDSKIKQIPNSVLRFSCIENKVDSLLLSDQNGYFSFKTLFGKYNVGIYKHGFRDTTFKFLFDSDSSFNIYNLTESPDYFPLNVGNWWKYNFKEIYSPSVGGYIHADSGIQKIEVTNLVSIDEKTRKYDIKIDFKGTRKIGIGSWGMFEKIDSVFQINYSYSFIAEDDIVGGIRWPLKKPATSGGRIWNIVYRHYLKSKDLDVEEGAFFLINNIQYQSLEFTASAPWNQYEKAYFSPNIGLVKTFQEDGHHEYYYTCRKTLIDFTIN